MATVTKVETTTYTPVVSQDEAELIATCLSRISDSQARYRPLHNALRDAGVLYENSHWQRENNSPKNGTGRHSQSHRSARSCPSEFVLLRKTAGT